MSTFIGDKCDPFGNATDRGPKHLMGGVFAANYEGGRKWFCENRAEGRFYMLCSQGHRGPAMPLCPDHVQEIQRRMSGLCTRCAYPVEAIQAEKDIESSQRDLQVLYQRGQMNSREAMRIKAKIEDIGHYMTELYQTGRIKKTPLRLIEMS